MGATLTPCFPFLFSVQGAPLQSGGVGIRWLHHAHRGVLQEQGGGAQPAGVRVAAVSPGHPATSRGLAVAACPAAGGWFREVGRTSESRVRRPGAGRGRLVLLMKGQCLGMLSAGKASAGAAWGWDSEWFLFYFSPRVFSVRLPRAC